MSSLRTLDSRIKAIEWQGDHLRLLDQRILPLQQKYIDYQNSDAIAEAITDMVVRGAPAIGITAAYAIVLAARDAYASAQDQWREAIQPALEKLAAARPTAVNLHWALAQMQQSFAAIDGNPYEYLLGKARQIHQDDIDACHAMGKNGAEIIGQANKVMTHCNAGALATGGYGTALGVIRTAFANQQISGVYSCETRPWLQGARLTAWELAQDNIPVTLIADTAPSHILKQGEVDWIIVGSDRIAANGDVANKIGTYQLAISAKYHGVKVMVAAPQSTIDWAMQSGDEIPIENRSADEVTHFAGKRSAAEDVAAENPAFDVTPADLVDAIVTEKGVVERPDSERMKVLRSI